ncbi:MAG: hypothetical protein ACRDV0_03395 [Acidimicrobiales bacterium]
MKIVTLCTGNAARSVMLAYQLTAIAEAQGRDVSVRSAGTHAAEGAGMSARTRDALAAIDLVGNRRFGSHRSHQVTAGDLAWADLVLGLEADHVRYARRLLPEAAGRVALVGQMASWETGDNWRQRITTDDVDPGFDVADPAGGDQAMYDDCAAELWQIAERVSALIA